MLRLLRRCAYTSTSVCRAIRTLNNYRTFREFFIVPGLCAGIWSGGMTSASSSAEASHSWRKMCSLMYFETARSFLPAQSSSAMLASAFCDCSSNLWLASHLHNNEIESWKFYLDGVPGHQGDPQGAQPLPCHLEKNTNIRKGAARSQR